MSALSYFYRSLVYAATIGAVLSFGALFSKHHLVFDLISHFRVQYLVLLSPAFILAMMIRKPKCVMIISLALAIHGYVLTMSILPRSSIASDISFEELTVLSSNVLGMNTNHQEILSIISDVNPDVIALQEYTPDWDTALSTVLSDYPHRIIEPRTDNFGIGLYSKTAFTAKSAQILNFNTYPTARAEITIGDHNIKLYSTHPPPPVSPTVYNTRNAVMQSLALNVAQSQSHVVVMGDFNATPWTAHYSDMTSQAKLHNARAGFGLHPTWPNHNPLLQIPIDHVLISDLIRSKHFESIKLDGSDHRVVWAKLRVYEKPDHVSN